MTSGMKWADIGPGSYIKWVDKDQTKHGLVIKKLSDSFSVRENGEKTVISVKFADAQLSGSSAIGGKFMANLREVGENTLVNGLFLRIIYGRDFILRHHFLLRMESAKSSTRNSRTSNGR